MDFATIASEATKLLVPYIVKGGEKFAETLGKKLPEGIVRLWSAVASRFKGRSAAEEAARDLAAKPEDEDNQAAFRRELKKAIEAEPTFAAELERLIEVARTTAIVNTGDGAVTIDGGVAAGKGGVAVGGDVRGDVRVNAPPKKGSTS